MALTFTSLDEIYSVLDNRYRKVDDCNEIMGNTDKRQDAIEKTQIETVTKLNIMIAILSAVAALIAPSCIKFLFGG